MDCVKDISKQQRRFVFALSGLYKRSLLLELNEVG